MQKLRPYVLPGLFLFHLVSLCTLISTFPRSGEPAASSLEAVQGVAYLLTILSQWFLTALWAG